MADYTVVLKSIAQGDYIQVAEALKSVLGLQEQVVGQIVSSLPIALFEGLAEGQARAIVQAMAPVEGAGAALEIASGPGGGYARMSWPEPPTIAGRDIDSFASAGVSGSIRCPVCGAALVLMPAGAGAPAPAAHVAAPVQTGPTFEVTGEDDLEMLGEVAAGAGAPDVPQVPAASRPPAAPTPSAAPAASGTKSGVPMDLEDFEASFAQQAEEELGRDDVLQELGEAQGRPVGGTKPQAPAAGAKAPVRTAGTRAQAPPVQPKKGPPVPRTGLGAPSTVFIDPKTAARRLHGKTRRKSGSGSAPSAGTGTYSVFAAKSNKPRFLELVAQVRGISTQEARNLAKRQVVQVARDVSQKEAETIRDRFLAERFQARTQGKGG